MKNSLKIKCKKIKLVVTDVDGVLTDGGRYFSSTGELLKKFHVRDGMAVNLLLRNNIKTIILTKETSKITKSWAKSMNITKVYSGAKIKEEKLKSICDFFDTTPIEMAFIGDDVNDINLLKKVGISASPSDGISQVKKMVDYVCKNSGGNGAFRELADLILQSKFPKKTNWY
ncbi:3-deoxy-D-manno-octulosonate 8-phosphate phosphatase [Candidatus Nitrosopelagicus brevis]|uniref:3-deoxy-D-manno-octulosonate 8-phosphate phosphatase n=1 Tax=Candidatus Nitrosopelagicus brevis TaxID=1410606 RepID=A0A0A7UZ82_9ARCH|nr:HAD hydrolase family protein [Candidatus Nitrosopelagicus brevis]AJA92067.1 3-deoxy-D-manno-octulosonate 8-phosphate phosphatase, YrbI family [Candidatus Nitrosopelagicus brevis]MAR69730.1 3-deoxy-D-manno-octulosonate 8-phosphate phosphatase [Nitrospina sp.]PTL87693.1 3-deoxy-D-manno-octulosonate 8-phosphate phosphatase [Candidatus Nitrosopelagicus brevis]|tara:strand:- start:1057 stop:1572 length:516 start_codon:yes stop_codon:yes gene_type:complete